MQVWVWNEKFSCFYCQQCFTFVKQENHESIFHGWPLDYLFHLIKKIDDYRLVSTPFEKFFFAGICGILDQQVTVKPTCLCSYVTCVFKRFSLCLFSAREELLFFFTHKCFKQKAEARLRDVPQTGKKINSGNNTEISELNRSFIKTSNTFPLWFTPLDVNSFFTKKENVYLSLWASSAYFLPSSHLFLLENPNHDPHRGREAEDSGGSASQPWHSSGKRWAVSAHALLHHGAVRTPAAVGIQDGLWAYGEGQTHPSNCMQTQFEQLRNLFLLFLWHYWKKDIFGFSQSQGVKIKDT